MFQITSFRKLLIGGLKKSEIVATQTRTSAKPYLTREADKANPATDEVRVENRNHGLA